jgi:DNA-binding protein H-NS
MAKTYEQLLKDKEELEAKIEEARKSEVSLIITDILEKIASYKLTAEDLGFKTAKTPGRKAGGTPKEKTEKVVKYRNPEEPEQTYSGHGRKPDWLKAKIAEGKTLEQFAV